MANAKQLIDRHGRTWTLKKVSWKDAEKEDARFWYEELTPEQRVECAFQQVLRGSQRILRNVADGLVQRGITLLCPDYFSVSTSHFRRNASATSRWDIVRPAFESAWPSAMAWST